LRISWHLMKLLRLRFWNCTLKIKSISGSSNKYSTYLPFYLWWFPWDSLKELGCSCWFDWSACSIHAHEIWFLTFLSVVSSENSHHSSYIHYLWFH
jgi:hypothetical protein